MEEARAGASTWPCCSFRGSFLKLNAATGAVTWKTYTTPQGWSGASVWGSAPPIDAARGQVVIATGDNYDLPAGELHLAVVEIERGLSDLPCARGVASHGHGQCRRA